MRKKLNKTKAGESKAARKRAVKKPAVKVARHRAPKAKAPRVAPPTRTPTEAEVQPKTVKLPKEFLGRLRKNLLDLRDHLIDGVNFLASDNLKRSSREVSGELSGYSLHMADAGTDNFDREFALSLVSNEQDALYEIEEALKRLDAGTYGVCEMCEKPIRKERLEAVPFARLCVRCQSQSEKERRRPMAPTATFSESAEEEAAEGEEAEE